MSDKEHLINIQLKIKDEDVEKHNETINQALETMLEEN